LPFDPLLHSTPLDTPKVRDQKSRPALARQVSQRHCTVDKGLCQDLMCNTCVEARWKKNFPCDESENPTKSTTQKQQRKKFSNSPKPFTDATNRSFLSSSFILGSPPTLNVKFCLQNHRRHHHCYCLSPTNGPILLLLQFSKQGHLFKALPFLLYLPVTIPTLHPPPTLFLSGNCQPKPILHHGSVFTFYISFSFY
jgi:hypothetical protein